MTRTLLDCGTVLTMDPDVGDRHDVQILIDEGELIEIAEEIEVADADVVDLSDHVVLPGLVNSHAHLFQTGLRGVGGDWTLNDYFQHMLGNLREHFDPEDVYLGNLFGAVEQLNAGVTSVLDWCHVINTPEHADGAVDGLIDSGIRARFAYGTPGVDIEEWYRDSTRTHPEDVRRMAEERLPADDGRVRLAMALRGPDLSSYDVTAHDIELARELGVPASMHIGVDAYEGSTDEEVAKLADDGLLGPDLNFVHANHLAPETFDLIGEADVSVSVTPEVEMQMGHGLPATGKAIDGGARFVLGSDVVSSIGSDMFTPMRFALQTQRALDNHRKIQNEESVDELEIDCRDVLRAATIEGAKALRLGDEVGSLTPGKRADLIAIRTDGINVAPVHDPAVTVVLHAEPDNVTDVFVDGARVKRDGDLRNETADERWDDLHESGRRLLADAGLDDHTIQR